jgi:FkbM family methyltransferase
MSLTATRQRFEEKMLTKEAYIEAMHEHHARLFEYVEYLRSTDIASLEIRDDGVTATYRDTGVKLICDPIDKRTGPIETLNFGSYEREEVSLFLAMIGHARTLFDIGANIGFYSITAAKTLPHLNVYAFEPIPKTYDYLARNVALNQAGNVRTHNFGFSEREENLSFYYYPEGSGNASTRNLSSASTVSELVCHVKRLDDFVAQQGVRVDAIKCDVEGAELLVFRAGLETLREHRPIILTEMLRKWSAQFGYHPNEIISLLRDIGYSCFAMRDGGLVDFEQMDESTIETNFFFLHPKSHGETIERFRHRSI